MRGLVRRVVARGLARGSRRTDGVPPGGRDGAPQLGAAVQPAPLVHVSVCRRLLANPCAELHRQISAPGRARFVRSWEAMRRAQRPPAARRNAISDWRHRCCEAHSHCATSSTPRAGAIIRPPGEPQDMASSLRAPASSEPDAAAPYTFVVPVCESCRQPTTCMQVRRPVGDISRPRRWIRRRTTLRQHCECINAHAVQQAGCQQRQALFPVPERAVPRRQAQDLGGRDRPSRWCCWCRARHELRGQRQPAHPQQAGA